MTENSWHANLKQTLRRVSDEVTSVAHIDGIFWQVQAIIATNSLINESDAFQKWLGDTYVDSVVTRIRRLADNDQRVVSLWRLLEVEVYLVPGRVNDLPCSCSRLNQKLQRGHMLASLGLESLHEAR